MTKLLSPVQTSGSQQLQAQGPGWHNDWLQGATFSTKRGLATRCIFLIFANVKWKLGFAEGSPGVAMEGAHLIGICLFSLVEGSRV